MNKGRTSSMQGAQSTGRYAHSSLIVEFVPTLLKHGGETQPLSQDASSPLQYSMAKPS